MTSVSSYGSWYQCPNCGQYLMYGMSHPVCKPYAYPFPNTGGGAITTYITKEPEMAKQHLTLRLPGDLVDSVDVMAEYRKEDKTALITKMLRFALAQKQGDCPHEEIEARICVSCGMHFPEPTDDF